MRDKQTTARIKYNLIILAGGPTAFIDYCGKPIAVRVLETYLELDRWHRISLVADIAKIHQQLPTDKFDYLQSLLNRHGVNIYTPGASPLDSFMNAWQEERSETEPQQLLWISASDMPLITARSIVDIAERVELLEGDLFYPVVARQRYIAQFSVANRTFVRMGRDAFCGTGIVIARAGIIDGLLEVARFFVDNRKQPLKLASFFGWQTVLKLLSGKLTLLEAEKIASQKLGLNAKVLLSSYPELAFNVDKQEDIEFLRTALQEC